MLCASPPLGGSVVFADRDSIMQALTANSSFLPPMANAMPVSASHRSHYFLLTHRVTSTVAPDCTVRLCGFIPSHRKAVAYFPVMIVSSSAAATAFSAVPLWARTTVHRALTDSTFLPATFADASLSTLICGTHSCGQHAALTDLFHVQNN